MRTRGVILSGVVILWMLLGDGVTNGPCQICEFQMITEADHTVVENVNDLNWLKNTPVH